MTWIEALERRHFADLTFAEVRKGLVALSSLYVERREKIASGNALQGAGKRAAFALYYGPLHFLLARAAVDALGLAQAPPRRILDLGCGTGSAGAAWAAACAPPPRLEGVDVNAWAVEETKFLYRILGLEGRARRGDLAQLARVRTGDAILLAYTVNELGELARNRLLDSLRESAAAGAAILILEPLAKAAAPWWPAWTGALTPLGARAEEWRFKLVLPDLLRRFDRAAGLDHRQVGARTLYLPSR